MEAVIGKAVQALVMLLTVVVNGQPAANQVPALEHEGKAYVEAVAFAQALGGQAAYDRQSKRLVVTLPQAAGAVMGTQQMAGEWAVMGQQYTLNEGDPLNFTLNSAEFSVVRLNVGDESVVAQGDEKLLVLHVTIQNPQSRARRVYWADLDFTAVDAMNVNREWSQELGVESTREPVDMDMKPAQKLDLYTAIVVPAKGVIPKLIVKSGEGKVLRYDLRQGVAPLEAPYVDPSDASGATALTKIEAEKDVWYPMGLFDVKFGGAELAAVDDDGDPPEEGEGFVVIRVTLRNGSADEERLYADPFQVVLRTTDGEKVEWGGEMLHPSRDESVNADLDPGDEMGARVFFRAPAGVKLDRCEFSEKEKGRVYVFGLGGMAVQGGGGAAGDALDRLRNSPLGGLF
jgi:hypothetical protein